MLKSVVLRRHTLLHLRAKKICGLAEELAIHQLINEQKINHFFEKKGSFLGCRSVCQSSDPDPLTFFCQNVDHKILSRIIRLDNYFILKSFALMQKWLKRLNFYNQNAKTSQIEKFKLLLKVGSDAIHDFMKDVSFVDVRENFKAALSAISNSATQSIPILIENLM
jgi:hypothetical protein